jgi:hypothetical protein
MKMMPTMTMLAMIIMVLLRLVWPELLPQLVVVLVLVVTMPFL